MQTAFIKGKLVCELKNERSRQNTIIAAALGGILLLCIFAQMDSREGREAAISQSTEAVTKETGKEEVAKRDEEPEESIRLLYEKYQRSFVTIESLWDIPKQGFRIIHEQIFPLEMAAFGEISIVPAFHREYNRLALFFVRKDGSIVYKTEELETNSRNRGELEQFTKGIAAISFRELNGDGAMDIVLITAFANEEGEYAGDSFKVGEVLFQEKDGTGFYRDYRITDKLNRFGMNKSADLIAAFVRDGYSMEFMYTATTLEELQSHGLKIITEQSYPRSFEKLGWLQVIPGTYRMADFEAFMVYLVNEEGYIVSSLQPMENYDNLYALRGISCQDIDGDGLKDIVVLARYSYEGEDRQLVIETDYSVYYQRTGGFILDREIKKGYRCSEEETMENLVRESRAYWGWKQEK